MDALTDREILPRCLEYNFWTWSAQAHVEPIPVKRAQGVYFWDTDDKRYLDLNSMVMCVNIGHGDQRVLQAIEEQARHLIMASPGMATRPRAELGETLAGITPGRLNRFLYTLGGAEANENAVKLARAFTGRTKILARYRSYHGATHGAIALTGDPRRWAWEPAVMPGVVHFLGPHPYRSPLHGNRLSVPGEVLSRDYLAHLEEIITLEGPDTIAAVILEPIPGTNGVLIPPDGYLPGVRGLCDRYGILLIADEVMTGFGRTGTWFAGDHWGVVPDMITMAKGLTSGYLPLGAVAMREEIAHFFDERVYYGGLTYNGHPLSLTAARANIQVIRQDGLLARSKAMGEELKSHLRRLKENHPAVGDVRSLGLFGAIELVSDRETRTPLAPFNGSSPEIEAFYKDLLAQGVFAYLHWNVLLIVPPLIITKEQLAEAFDGIDRALGKLD